MRILSLATRNLPHGLTVGLILLFILPGGFTFAQTSQKGKGIANAQKEIYRGPTREDYVFSTELILGEYGVYDKIRVWAVDENEAGPRFEDEYELYQEFTDEGWQPEEWISEEDINFDGVPDILVFLGTNAYGSVSDHYAAYLWDPENHCFESVPDFGSIPNPDFDPDRRTIAGVYRSGPNNIVYDTYMWQDGKLVLMEREEVPINEDEDSLYEEEY